MMVLLSAWWERLDLTQGEETARVPSIVTSQLAGGPLPG
jgi:hypothetical protein